MCAGAAITPERKWREALRAPLSPSPSPELGLSVVINIRLTGHTAKIDLPQTCYNYFYCTLSCFSGLWATPPAHRFHLPVSLCGCESCPARLSFSDSSVLLPYFFPSGHKQKSLRAVALSPRQGRGHGIHHSLWLSYTSAQLKVKAITGLSLPLWPPPLSLFFALLFTKLYFSYSPPWPHFLRSHRAAWAFSPSSVLTCALFFLRFSFCTLVNLLPSTSSLVSFCFQSHWCFDFTL